MNDSTARLLREVADDEAALNVVLSVVCDGPDKQKNLERTRERLLRAAGRRES